MIFKTITLVNFRQYRDENTFEFPVSNNKKISLIIAPNGVGKTTFSQAVRFCFFGEIPNVLKLPKPEENLNYSLINELKGGDEAELAVKIQFLHNGIDYIASRTITFVKEAYPIYSLKRLKNKFEVWENSEVFGYRKVEDPEKRIKEMMPIGLAHIYIFDGERVEKPIGSNEFKKDLKESIVGILGLNKLAQAQIFLGNQTKSSSLIGRVKAQLQPLTSSEQDILNKDTRARRVKDDALREISDLENGIKKLSNDIDIAKEAQASVNELKLFIEERKVIESKVALKKADIEKLVSEGNSIALKLTFKLELAKTYKKYQDFVNNEGDQQEVFDSLYESVVQDVLKRGTCICGRAVHEGGDETHYLRSLAVLPYDNAHYLNSLRSLYASLDDMPELLNKVKAYNLNIIKEQMKLEELQKEFDKIDELISEKEKERGEDNQTNINILERHRATFYQKIQNKKREIRDSDDILSSIKGQLNRIKSSTEHNFKVNKSLEMLEALKLDIDEELERKKRIARTSIEENMNIVLSEVMTQKYEVELDEDYSIKVLKIIENSRYRQDETDVLSTGQNVVIYLSFLKALLMTIEKHSEFADVQSSGVIMDAALSNLDEEHIEQISQKILGSFDQLIFLSYKAQLRKELIAGIKENISNVYELSKNELGNIVCSTRSIETIEEYVNEGGNHE